jgi:sugar phosphate isomerase/epimerase
LGIHRPNVSLCQLSFLDTDFVEDVEIAKQVGVGGLGVIESKIADLNVDHKTLLQEAGLRATLCAPEVLAILPSPGIEWWFPGPRDIDARVERIASGVQRLSSLNPDTIFCLTGPSGEFGEAKARSIIVEALRSFASIAADLGTRIAIEPMRTHFRSEWTLVSDLRECLDLLDEVGEDNAGIVFDIWHMWDSAQVHDMIPLAAGRIFGVQVSDYREPNRGPRDRVVAGEGVAGVAVLVAELRSAGYEGWYDLELFSDDGRFGYEYEDSLWKLPPLEFAARQVDGFLRCYKASS